MNAVPSAASARRAALRRFVNLDCHVVREFDGKVVADLAIDLSPDGMLVATDTKVLTGEDVMVSFWPRHDEWIEVKATVARVVHGRRPGDHGRCLGLEFHGLHGSARALLDVRLRGIAPPIPARDPRATPHRAMPANVTGLRLPSRS